MATSHLILGGARSGKSRFAVALHASTSRVVFVATAQARDGAMAERIARHKAERPSRWLTIEEPHDLGAALERLGRERRDAVIVDCLTLWAANRMLRGDSDEAILAESDRVAALLGSSACDVTLITNEVGEGVHPSTVDGLRFQDLLGLVNQRIAAACDRLTLMVAGVPLTVKSAGPGHDLAQQAP